MMDAPKRCRLRWLVVAIVFTLVLPGTAKSAEQFSVSIPGLGRLLEADEGIASFEINVTGGRIVSFPRAPNGWGICINNELSGKTRIGGNIILTVALLDPDYFSDFIVIEKASGEVFDIEAKIGTYKRGVSHNQRLLSLKSEDIHMKSLKKD